MLGHRYRRGRTYGYWDDYRPPEFSKGDRVQFRRGRVPRRSSGGAVVVWEVVDVGVKRPHDWRDRIRVRSERSGRVCVADPTHIVMVESAAARVARAVMGV